MIGYEERRVILIQGAVIASACFDMRVESIHRVCMDAEFHNFKHSVSVSAAAFIFMCSLNHW